MWHLHLESDDFNAQYAVQRAVTASEASHPQNEKYKHYAKSTVLKKKLVSSGTPKCQEQYGKQLWGITVEFFPGQETPLQ